MKTNFKLLVFLGVATLTLFFDACKKNTPPTVRIHDAVSTSYTSANVTGEVTDEGSSFVTERGFIYGKQGESKQDTMFCGSGTGEFPTRLTGLKPNTTYNCFAFARNDGGMGTSGKVTFTTRDHDLPIVTTSEIENVGATTASCGGNVIDDGGAEVTERGVCWSTSHSPIVTGNHISAGNGLGEFVCNMTNLSANTTYYVRAYAKNSKGVAYGEERHFKTTDFDLPEVTTADVTDITQTSAKGGGNVTSDGGTTVTERGICWSTSHNPTVSGNHTSSGTGMGNFNSNMTGLNAHTTYYVRAYATNSKGTAYGEQLSFSTATNPPTVSTGNVTSITTTSAMGSGNVTSDGGNTVTERGLCWGTTSTPTVAGPHATAGSGTGQFTAAITGLSVNTTYYVRAYAINGTDTAYGDAVSFITLSISVPGVTTANATNISYTTATCGGNVVSDGGASVTERGICWGTSPNPTMSNTHLSNGTGTGSFTVNLTNLTPNATYHVRAYAVNRQGTAYGNDVTLQTPDYSPPTVTTKNVTAISYTTATCGGTVASDGGAVVTARGVCWSTSQNPTVNSSHTTNGTGTGSFTSSLTSLTANTTYYVRAYATNSKGTSYGVQKTFTTTAITKPTVITNNVTAITATTATCGGNVTADGGATVTARGVCWGTSQNPTVSGSHTTNGTGTGSFTSNITGLAANTTYYVRAYATNSKGTAYGVQKNFTTPKVAPTGGINALYSVSGTQQVWFSQGNLQYRASDGVWRFATNQYDYIGEANSNISSTYSGWIDLFGWGTGNNPTNNSTNNSNYSTFTDWGINPISNGGNTANQWRTLNSDEWSFLLFNRTTNTGIRFAKATVNGVTGVIILPDNWSTSYYTLNSTNKAYVSYSVNMISSASWTNNFEAYGAIFLPAAGYREGTVFGWGYLTSSGYWSSTPSNPNSVGLYFRDSDLRVSLMIRCHGYSVRLVSDE